MHVEEARRVVEHLAHDYPAHVLIGGEFAFHQGQSAIWIHDDDVSWARARSNFSACNRSSTNTRDQLRVLDENSLEIRFVTETPFNRLKPLPTVSAHQYLAHGNSVPRSFSELTVSAIREERNHAMVTRRKWKPYSGTADAEVLWQPAIPPQEVLLGEVVVQDLQTLPLAIHPQSNVHDAKPRQFLRCTGLPADGLQSLG